MHEYLLDSLYESSIDIVCGNCMYDSNDSRDPAELCEWCMVRLSADASRAEDMDEWNAIKAKIEMLEELVQKAVYGK